MCAYNNMYLSLALAMYINFKHLATVGNQLDCLTLSIC